MHDGMPYGRNQGQGQGHSREVDRQSPTGLIFFIPFLLLSSYIIDFMYIMIMNVFVPLSHIKRLLTYLIKLERLIKVS